MVVLRLYDYVCVRVQRERELEFCVVMQYRNNSGMTFQAIHGE